MRLLSLKSGGLQLRSSLRAIMTIQDCREMDKNCLICLKNSVPFPSISDVRNVLVIVTIRQKDPLK